MRNRSSGGFSLLEVTGVVILASLLLAGVVMAMGNSRDRALQQRVASDLGRLAQAKASWRAANPIASFPSDESARFQLVSSYLGFPSEEVPGNLSIIQPSGVAYSVNSEGTYPSATSGGLNFDPVTETFH